MFAARRKAGLHLAGLWEFPGGKVEIGEAHEVALVRELYEELGITVDIQCYIGQSTYDYTNKKIRLHAYLCDADMSNLELSDHDQTCWLTKDELFTLEWAPADIALLNQLSTYFYYDTEAESYTTETLAFNMKGKYSSFFDDLPENASVLDIGCGSGRDCLVFQSSGYDVTAIDVSEKIARVASKNLRQEVSVKSCFNMNFENEFDGVWACASLLHCPKSEFPSAIENIIRGLKPLGRAYISLKKGDGELLDKKGRHFSFYEQLELDAILIKVKGIAHYKVWVDESQLRGVNQSWVNVLMYKDSI